MKSLKLLLPIVFLCHFVATAQVGINNTDPKATLDVTASNVSAPANTDGILIPRINAFPAINPNADQQGMMVYLNFLIAGNLPGFYYWDNASASWKHVSGAKKINDLQDAKTDNTGSSIYIGDESGYQDNNSDNKNVGLGYKTLRSNINGTENVALGYQSLYNGAYTYGNIAAGYYALRNNNGDRNVALGSSSMENNYNGDNNTAVGYQAGYHNVNISGNIYLGYKAGYNNNQSNKLFIDNSDTNTPLIGGDFSIDRVDINGTIKITGGNPGFGKVLTSNANGQASWENLTANFGKIDDLSDAKSDSDGTEDGSSIFIGINAGQNDNSTDNKNVGIGYQAIQTSTSGFSNVGIGYQAMQNGGYNYYNVAIGYHALQDINTGHYNTAIGAGSGLNNQGNGNIFIGYNAGRLFNGDNHLFIDNNHTNTPLIGGDFDVNRVDINGMIKITGGNPGNGKILTSDANGLASWETKPVGADGSIDTHSDVDVSTNIPTVNQVLGWNGTNWVPSDAVGAQKIDDLSDAKSDNDGTNDGSSIFLGIEAGLNDNNTDNKNVAVGYQAIKENITGTSNIAMGYQAMPNNMIGSYNIAIGRAALYSNINKSRNVAIGTQSGYNNQGAGNIFIGNQSGYYFTGNNRLFIDNTSTANPLIGGDFNVDRVDINGDIKINGTIRITGGNPGTDKVLTSTNYSGNAQWTTLRLNSLDDAKSDNDGTNNGSSVFIGVNSGLNDDETDNQNVGMGYGTLQSNGAHNTAMGYYALINSGQNNTAIGHSALLSNTGSSNVAIGVFAGGQSTGNGNIFIGNFAGGNYTGSNKLFIDNTSTNNPLIGGDFFLNTVKINGTIQITGGSPNMGEVLTTDNFGNATWESLANTMYIDDLIDGKSDPYFSSVFLGMSAGLSTGPSKNSTGIGFNALKNNTGASNTAIGYRSLYSNTTGFHNVAIGNFASLSNTIGYKNTSVGYNSKTLNYHNATAIGYNAAVSGHNTIRLGNSSVNSIGGYANWSNVSDRRFKTDIQENVVGLDFIKKLRPVTYHLDMDAIAKYNKTPDSLRLPKSERLKAAELQTGFIAQEVEQAAQSLSYDFHGVDAPKNENDHYGLRYAEFVVPLTKAVQELNEKQESENKMLNKKIKTMDKQLKHLINENKLLKQKLSTIKSLEERLKKLEKQ